MQIINWLQALEDTGLLEFVGICVAVAIFVIGYALDVQRRRKMSAFEFVTQITITEPIITESRKMYDLLHKYRHKQPSLSDLSEGELETVLAISSFYEFLGLSLLQRLLNRKIVLLSRYAAMRQTWYTFEHVIKERREVLDRRFLFGSFEKAVLELGPAYESYQARAYPEQYYPLGSK